MKLAVLFLCAIALSFAQTLPTLPATSTITGTASGTTCVFDVQDSAGGLLVTCTRSDGSQPAAPQFTIPSDYGTLAGLDDVLCIYWNDATTTPVKWRLQCANSSNKVVLDGYIPTNVVKKKRWHMFWW